MPGQVTVSGEWVGPGGVVHSGVVTPPSSSTVRRAARITAGDRVRAGGAPSRPARGERSGWDVTAQDEACLAGLLRYGSATWRQCAAAFYPGAHEVTQRRRLKYLREVGWARAEIGETWYGNVLWATAAGARVMADQMRVQVPPGGYPGNAALHRLALTDLGLRMESAGELTITEREVRALEGNGEAHQFLTRLGAAGDRSVRDGKGHQRHLVTTVGADATLHYPDLVHVRPGKGGRGMNAVEVEITPKTAHRARQILLSYRDAGLFDRVLYYATAQVSAQLQGYPDRDGNWRDGLLQQIGMYPTGVDPTQFVKDQQPLIVVLPIEARDRGVAYRLDMRQVPEQAWVSRSEWAQLRRSWKAWVTDQGGIPVPFLTWWMDVHRPLEIANR